MSTVQKIQTATFVISKKLQGYRLLQNPLTASPYEVNMIRQFSSGRALYGEHRNIYDRIKRTIDRDGIVRVFKSQLTVTRFFNKRSQNLSKEKNVVFTREKDECVDIILNLILINKLMELEGLNSLYSM